MVCFRSKRTEKAIDIKKEDVKMVKLNKYQKTGLLIIAAGTLPAIINMLDALETWSPNVLSSTLYDLMFIIPASTVAGTEQDGFPERGFLLIAAAVLMLVGFALLACTRKKNMMISSALAGISLAATQYFSVVQRFKERSLRLDDINRGTISEHSGVLLILALLSAGMLALFIVQMWKSVSKTTKIAGVIAAGTFLIQAPLFVFSNLGNYALGNDGFPVVTKVFTDGFAFFLWVTIIIGLISLAVFCISIAVKKEKAAV